MEVRNRMTLFQRQQLHLNYLHCLQYSTLVSSCAVSDCDIDCDGVDLIVPWRRHFRAKFSSYLHHSNLSS